jgi:hypothetical protein
LVTCRLQAEAEIQMCARVVGIQSDRLFGSIGEAAVAPRQRVGRVERNRLGKVSDRAILIAAMGIDAPTADIDLRILGV